MKRRFRIERPRQPLHSGTYTATEHAIDRLQERGIPSNAIEEVLTYGRIKYARGAKLFVIGRKEVQMAAKANLDLAPFRNVHVVVQPEFNQVLTVYRNDHLQLRTHKYGPSDLTND